MKNWVLYTRVGCGLCEKMYAEIIQFEQQHNVSLSLELVDVDRRSELAALYGSRVPVLEYNDEVVCQYHFSSIDVKALKEDVE